MCQVLPGLALLGASNPLFNFSKPNVPILDKVNRTSNGWSYGLLKPRNSPRGWKADVSVLWIQPPSNKLEESGFANAIPPNDSYFVSSVDGKSQVFKERSVFVTEVDS